MAPRPVTAVESRSSSSRRVRFDRRLTLDAGNDGSITVGGFATAGGANYLRATSVVLALDNATQGDDGLAFGISAALISGSRRGDHPQGLRPGLPTATLAVARHLGGQRRRQQSERAGRAVERPSQRPQRPRP